MHQFTILTSKHLITEISDVLARPKFYKYIRHTDIKEVIAIHLKLELFFFMEANARHVRDVDARHAGRWFGNGTRHGVQHWSDGNHEERQTVSVNSGFITC